MGGLLFVVLEIISRWVVLGGVRTIIYTKSSDARLVTRSMTDSGLVGSLKSPLRNWGKGSGEAGERESGGAGEREGGRVEGTGGVIYRS